MMVQFAARDFNLAYNAQGGAIHMPDLPHDQTIHQAIRELLEDGNSAMLRRFQRPR